MSMFFIDNKVYEYVDSIAREQNYNLLFENLKLRMTFYKKGI